MRLLFVSLAIWAFTFGDVDAAQPEPFSFDCRYLDEHSISGQGIRPRPSKKVIETLQEGSRMKLSYGGKEVIFWISNKGNLVQHLKIIQKNDRLLTAIIKRHINDGAPGLALDAEDRHDKSAC